MSKLIEMKRRRDPEWKPSHVDFVMQLDASRDKSLQGSVQNTLYETYSYSKHQWVIFSVL